ncbi:MAG: RluA family pseudouridine synthase [Clostridiales bacterium]|nr:RluA family pseudouridine synthase [Clostridiales bacterium]
MEKVISKIVEHPMELYDFLRIQLGITKKEIRQLKFREPGILVNGERQRVTWKLEAGDEVIVHLENPSQCSSQLIPKGERPLQILYEDEDVCLVNKPAGIPTHPGGKHYEETIANWLMALFYERGESLRIRPVGRLDKETSGGLLFAKNRGAAGRLSEQRTRGILWKEYIALAAGRMEKREGVICAPLSPVPGVPCQMYVSPEGKEAVTHYQVICQYEDYAALRIRLDTGRMHQIRVHMASLNHPLLGDSVYGGPGERIERTALHAGRLHFHQPFTGETVDMEIPLPDDMACLLPETGIVKESHGKA